MLMMLRTLTVHRPYLFFCFFFYWSSVWWWEHMWDPVSVESPPLFTANGRFAVEPSCTCIVSVSTILPLAPAAQNQECPLGAKPVQRVGQRRVQPDSSFSGCLREFICQMERKKHKQADVCLPWNTRRLLVSYLWRKLHWGVERSVDRKWLIMTSRRGARCSDAAADTLTLSNGSTLIWTSVWHKPGQMTCPQPPSFPVRGASLFAPAHHISASWKQIPVIHGHALKKIKFRPLPEQHDLNPGETPPPPTHPSIPAWQQHRSKTE